MRNVWSVFQGNHVCLQEGEEASTSWSNQPQGEQNSCLTLLGKAEWPSGQAVPTPVLTRASDEGRPKGIIKKKNNSSPVTFN